MACSVGYYHWLSFFFFLRSFFFFLKLFFLTQAGGDQKNLLGELGCFETGFVGTFFFFFFFPLVNFSLVFSLFG